MNDITISAANLGKCYLIGHDTRHNNHYALRDLIAYKASLTWKRTKDLFSGKQILYGDTTEEFWALKGACFKIHRGEVVGIIGRNGAGKSTLLKLLSRITEPSTGRIEIKGRIASLLEVGTGFHPELTGRENIYLNGAILGMTRSEIKSKFDEIIAFAEVENFLDTPVKRYSSGMYVRLAFAVAAHIEPDILVVDEVLSVGDVKFQKKCLGKMGQVSKSGRTVLFVSHNMGAIEQLCSRTILLDHGRIIEDGNTNKVVSKYMSNCMQSDASAFHSCKRTGSGEIRVTSCHFETENGHPLSFATSSQNIAFIINYECFSSIDDVSFSFSIHAANEMGLFLNYSHFSDITYSCTPGTGSVKCTIPNLSLTPKDYLIGLRIQTSGGKEIDYPRTFVPFPVQMGDYYGIGSYPATFSKWGYFLVNAEWDPELKSNS